MARRVKQPSASQKENRILLENQGEFGNLTEVAASAIFVYRRSRLLYFNPATEQLTGYTHLELFEVNFIDLLHGNAKKAVRNLEARLRLGKEISVKDQFKIVNKNNEERWVDLSLRIIDYEGKAAYFGTAFDITELKRGEFLQDAVYRIARAADQSRHLDDLFPLLHAIISEVMNTKNFYIALYDKEIDIITFPYYVDEYDLPPGPSKPARGLTEYILRTGKSLLCDLETHHRLEEEEEVELIGTASPIWLGVPLIIDGKVIGVMVVQHYSDPHVYGEREQRILEFVSSQVAMVINRKKSDDALQASEARYRQRIDELSALLEITHELTTQRDITSLLQTIVDRAVSLSDSTAGSIFLYNVERNELELMVAHGSTPPEGTRLKPGEGISGQVAKTHQPILVDDYREWEFRSNKLDILPIAAVVAVPMLYGGELVGVVTIYELEENAKGIRRTYSQSDIDILAFFAGAAASAIHNGRLLLETQQRLVELELLYQASLAAAQIHSLRAVAQRIIDTLEHLLNWGGSIWLLDVDNQRPVLFAHNSKGLTGEKLKAELDRIGNLIPSMEHGIIGYVCRYGRTVRSGDVKNEPHYVVADSSVCSELCVPLKAGGKTIGCINVEGSVPDAFSEHDERLLTTLANQAAVAIENARLFEETRRRSVRQAALNTIITAATRASADIDTILNTVLEQTLKALNLDMGAIWLISSPRHVQRIAANGIPSSISMMMANASLTGDLSFTRNFVVDDWSKVKHEFSEPFISVGIRSAIVVPLSSEGKRIGGLVIASSLSHQWTTEEIALVEAIGREVGAAAERANLFEETQTRLIELEAVNKISITLRLAQSIEEMLPPLIDESLKALDADTGGIWLYYQEGDCLRQVIGRGWCTNISHMELGKWDGVPGAVFTIGDIYFSSDIYRDPITPIAMREFIPPGWSVVCVPIRSKQETIGAFLVSTRLPREFNGENARLLVTLTEITGNAIHRMRLDEQTKRHAEELEGRVAERTAELQEALQKAQAADRLKSEFIANVNHELRTPLTNLVLYYQMIRAQPTVKTEERLNVIGRELQRLRNLIEDLLNLSRLDLGQVTLRSMPHDLNALIQTLADDRRSLAEERGLTLTTDLQPDLPSVWLDEAMIVQAVSNLLTNALNYTGSGGNVSVRTMMEVQDGELWIGLSVRDTGLGINDEELPHLFERFYRGRAAHDSGAPGTGLGLAIVKQVVEYHHGRIEVNHGDNGQGSIFTIWLPIQQNRQETV